MIMDGIANHITTITVIVIIVIATVNLIHIITTEDSVTIIHTQEDTGNKGT